MSEIITQNQAVGRLQNGALGVGEDHLNPAARLFVKRLIEGGHVRALFLECDSSAQENFDNAVSDASRKEITENAGPQYDPGGPTLGDLALLALANQVSVHFIDKDVPKKTTKPNPALRDAHAAERFTDITASAGTAGCLVLYGMVHLDRTKDVRNRFYYRDDKWLGALIDLGIVLFEAT